MPDVIEVGPNSLHDPRVRGLRESFRQAWNAETSVDPGWSEANPSLGQCAVTSLIVQDLLGGELVRAEVGEVSHYWNRLDDGVEVDLTRDQFAAFSPVNISLAPRERMVSH